VYFSGKPSGKKSIRRRLGYVGKFGHLPRMGCVLALVVSACGGTTPGPEAAAGSPDPARLGTGGAPASAPMGSGGGAGSASSADTGDVAGDAGTVSGNGGADGGLGGAGGGLGDAHDSMPAWDGVEVDLSIPDAARSIDLGAGVDGSAASPDAMAEVGSGTSADATALDPRTDGAPHPSFCQGGCPTEVAPGRVQLWLRGDEGIDCELVEMRSRVALWRDLSGHQRDARPPQGQRGPFCGGPDNVVAGRAAITFPAETTDPAGGFLEADLGGLVKSAFTVAVVERRSNPFRAGAWILGSKLPFAESTDCASNPNAGIAFKLGYDGPVFFTATTWGPGCDLRQAVPAMAPGPILSVVTFDPQEGFTAYRNGMMIGKHAAGRIEAIMTGLIGADAVPSMTVPVDSRYQGEIAEIAAFDVAISSDQRLRLEGYLKQAWGTGP
jgi:hypothetical protein